MLHGLIVVDKERGMSSHQVLAKMRAVLGQRELGHTGTLDPDATGVLVVGLGAATRSFQFLDEGNKIYRAELTLGSATDTQDASGQVIAENRDFLLTQAELTAAVNSFIGTIKQIPPMYSAVKQQGKKLYELARNGIEVERVAREITVFKWELLTSATEYHYGDRIEMIIECSRGTYVRTLLHDLGEQLKCYAHMSDLRRLKSGDFSLETALTLAEIKSLHDQGKLKEHLVSLPTALNNLSDLLLDEIDLNKVDNGGKISYFKYQLPIAPESFAKVAVGDKLIAVMRLKDNGDYLYWQPEKVFRYDLQ